LGEGEKIFPLSGWMDWIWEGETDPVRLNSRPARRLGGANREGTGPTGWLGRAGRSKATPRQKKKPGEKKSLCGGLEPSTPFGGAGFHQRGVARLTCGPSLRRDKSCAPWICDPIPLDLISTC
jgi:hypothetical protein